MSYILNDIEGIYAADRGGMLNFYVQVSDHYRQAVDLAQKLDCKNLAPNNLVIAGMGGSAIGGDILKDWCRSKLIIPLEVCRAYDLPEYADKKTLVLISSYSGDTEETLSLFLDALKRKCMIFCITSGGEVLKAAKRHGVPYIEVPCGIPPPHSAALYVDFYADIS